MDPAFAFAIAVEHAGRLLGHGWFHDGFKEMSNQWHRFGTGTDVMLGTPRHGGDLRVEPSLIPRVVALWRPELVPDKRFN